MADITSFDITIQTGDVNGAGTDGSVYLGICGREFHLDTSKDDFERRFIYLQAWGRSKHQKQCQK